MLEKMYNRCYNSVWKFKLYGINRMFNRVLLLILLVTAMLSAVPREVTILFSGNNDGKYRDCGCPYENLGGLAERKTLIDSLRSITDNLLLFDTGDILNPFLKQDDRDDMVAEIYPLLGYDAVCVGDQELIAGTFFYQEKLAKKLPMVSCNLTFKDSTLNPAPYRIFEVKNGLKVGVTGLNYFSGFVPLVSNKNIGKDEVMVDKAADMLKKTLAKMKDKCDVVILLAHLNQEGIAKILDHTDGYQVLIGGHNNPEYIYPRLVKDKIHLQPGYNGDALGKLTLTIDNGKVVSHTYRQEKVLSDLYEKNEQVNEIIKKRGYR